MNKNNNIGIFDSGVGGFSVLQSIRALLPHEHLVYVADSAHVPYGNKSPKFIQQRSIALTKFLLQQQNAKAIVVACNTATAAAVSILREQFSLPIIGMEPAVKPAAAASKNKIIGVLATEGTLKSTQFAALLERFAQDIKVITQPCHGLVEKVEQGLFNDISTRELVVRYTKPLLEQGVDTIILGCTHYSFLSGLIADIVGKNITLIDTADAVARRVKQVLSERESLREEKTKGECKFFTSGNLADARRVMPILLGEKINVEALPENFL
ncbi:MAG: glutamate racemase [Burkholderiales bacterium]